jgi:hypothetical protein
MTIEKDNSGQEYIEFALTSGSLRLTRVPEAWHGGTALRVQIREEDGHLRQGPDIPVGKLGQMFSATLKLFGVDR